MTATNVQTALDELDEAIENKSVFDGDGDPQNEIELPDQTDQAGKVLTTDGVNVSWVAEKTQTLSLEGNELTLSGEGGTVTLPSGGGDSDPAFKFGVYTAISDNASNVITTNLGRKPKLVFLQIFREYNYFGSLSLDGLESYWYDGDQDGIGLFVQNNQARINTSPLSDGRQKFMDNTSTVGIANDDDGGTNTYTISTSENTITITESGNMAVGGELKIVWKVE